MYRRILVPVDGSDTSNHALVMALRMAEESGGQVRLVHVLDGLAHEDAERVLQRALAIADDADVAAETRLIAQPDRRLGELVAEQALAWPADLVVVGTHGRRGVGRVLLGSGAEQVIRLAPVPVLAVRP